MEKNDAQAEQPAVTVNRILLLLGAVLVIWWVVSGLTDSDSGQPVAAGEKFTQTWPRPYGETTCEAWADSMSPSQHRVAAADMLVGAQSRDGGTELPSDVLIARFAGDIGETCTAAPTSPITEIAVAIYLIGDYQP